MPDGSSRLPLEQVPGEALRLYRSRVGVFALVIAANGLLLGGVALVTILARVHGAAGWFLVLLGVLLTLIVIAGIWRRPVGRSPLVFVAGHALVLAVGLGLWAAVGGLTPGAGVALAAVVLVGGRLAQRSRGRWAVWWILAEGMVLIVGGPTVLAVWALVAARSSLSAEAKVAVVGVLALVLVSTLSTTVRQWPRFLSLIRELFRT